MSPLLRAYEKDCQASRMAAPDLPACLNEAYRQLGCQPGQIFSKVNQTIIDLMEADARLVEHAYHNRHHVRDVLFAVVLLLKQTDIPANSPANIVDCMITAALGHDLHHDGMGTTSKRDVERQSAKAIVAIGHQAGLPPEDLNFIEGLILATYPPVQLSLRQQLTSAQTRTQDELLSLMFGEADVLASLTPNFGKTLSIALTEEWRKAELIFPSMPDEDAGRARFLGCYRLLTPSAQELGVDVMVSDQLRILEGKTT